MNTEITNRLAKECYTHRHNQYELGFNYHKFAEMVLKEALGDVKFWYWDNGGDIEYAIQIVKEKFGIKE
jgi:hypothetical protein